jgi:hypothetical protein
MKLAAMPTSMIRVGASLLNPADAFIATAQTISKSPARKRNIHAIIVHPVFAGNG